MYQIHPNARTTPAVRAAIAASTESSGVLAKRYGVSPETIRKWRKRGTEDVQDHSSRPQHLRWRATDEERAIVCELRRSTGFPLDDLTFTVRYFLPHLNRDSIYRILKAGGLNRLPPRPSTMPAKPINKFKTYDLGFLHIDIKHLPKLQTAERRAAQTLPLRRHRPRLAHGPFGRQGRGERSLRERLPEGGGDRFSLRHHPCAHR